MISMLYMNMAIRCIKLATRECFKRKSIVPKLSPFISEFTKREVESIFNLIGKETHVIYNGISLGEIAEEPSMKPEGKILFSIGTVLPKKIFMC